MLFVTLIIILMLLLFFTYFYRRPPTTREMYENIYGYECNENIVNLNKTLETKKHKTVEDLFILAEINKYNLDDQVAADQYYAEALQMAIENEDAQAQQINDRLHADVPLPMDAAPAAIRSDPQNVHDSNVVQQIRKKYFTIANTPSISKENEQRMISGFSPKALIVYNKIKNNQSVMESINASDYEVLLKVANRGDHIWPALNGNLEQCLSPDDNTVCLTGRISQIMDSLTLLDPQAGTPVVTLDILRKEIFDDVSNYINNLPEHRRTAYESGDEEIGDEVDQHLRQKYSNLAEPPVLNKILLEVQAGF